MTRVLWAARGAALGACILSIGLAPSTAGAQSARPVPRVAATTKSTEEVAAIGRRATVTIVTFDAAGDTVGQGSGVLIREDGVLVTNWHVMAGASRARVRLTDGEVVDRVMYLEGDSTADLAILRIATLRVPAAPTTAVLPAPGARVTVIGAPLGLSHTVSDGVVSATRLLNGKTLVQITAPISPGSSGGPVFDSQGRVFAIATSSLDAGQALNFATPLRYALALLPLAGAPRPLDDVFASVVATERQETTTKRTPSAPRKALPGGFEWPRPTERPVRSLAGAYLVTTRYASRPTADPRANGLIVLDDEKNGFLMIDRETGPAFDMLDAITTQTGRVSFKLLSDELATGYQTEDGMFAFFPLKGDTAFFTAVRADLSLERPDGLFDVSMRTRYITDDGWEGKPVDWRGTAIVAATRDTLWMTVILRNEGGGSTAAWAKSPIGSDGGISWRDQKGNSIRGTVKGGAFDLQWVDRRDKAEYRGILSGRRR